MSGTCPSEDGAHGTSCQPTEGGSLMVEISPVQNLPQSSQKFLCLMVREILQECTCVTAHLFLKATMTSKVQLYVLANIEGTLLVSNL